jgi:hypothetical protein
VITEVVPVSVKLELDTEIIYDESEIDVSFLMTEEHGGRSLAISAGF